MLHLRPLHDLIQLRLHLFRHPVQRFLGRHLAIEHRALGLGQAGVEEAVDRHLVRAKGMGAVEQVHRQLEARVADEALLAGRRQLGRHVLDVVAEVAHDLGLAEPAR